MNRFQFNNPEGQRGSAVVVIPMRMLYQLIRARLEWVKGDFDPDALCQNICVEIEKHQGTYPNIYHKVVCQTCKGTGEPLEAHEADTETRCHMCDGEGLVNG